MKIREMNETEINGMINKELDSLPSCFQGSVNDIDAILKISLGLAMIHFGSQVDTATQLKVAEMLLQHAEFLAEEQDEGDEDEEDDDGEEEEDGDADSEDDA